MTPQEPEPSEPGPEPSEPDPSGPDPTGHHDGEFNFKYSQFHSDHGHFTCSTFIVCCVLSFLL